MNKEQITWAPLIPLIGGFPLGAEQSIGKPPVGIFSYNGFQGNDQHYVNYIRNIRGLKNIEYTLPNDDIGTFDQRNIDIVVCTPPCAGLSSLNSSSSPEARGPGCHKNDWMYQSAEDAITRLGAKVVLGENAPRLFTKTGTPVADKLNEIARKHGYSLTLYKTSTIFHGVPQNRDRCFYILWKSKYAPLMEWYKMPYRPIEDYITDVSDPDLLHNDVIINHRITEEPMFKFLNYKTEGRARETLLEAKKTTSFAYVYDNNLLDESLAYLESIGHDSGVRFVKNAKYKFSINKGIWDGSVHVFPDHMNACIGRNMSDSLHPHEDRSMSVREALHMMAFPNDFEVINTRRNINHIAQNVPVCTAKCMVDQAVKFLEGSLSLTNSRYNKQDNYKESTNFIERNDNSIENYFG